MENKGIFNEVELLDEEGKKVLFDHVMTFVHEGEKYIALLPLEEVDGVGHDEVVLMRIVRKGSEDVYEPIGDDALLDEVFERFLELFEQMEEDEDEDD
ncbi:MAG: hypothetical protein BWY11_00670 [Firmicutes bacterium ADurb.Bin182]|nr:MAG: hypothetical protein BWY11_00670 [Firmicutes bacterium ADurb.Bin182]